MDVPLTQILLVHLVSMTAVQSQITKGPVNALKKVGDNVTLECVTSSKNCDGVDWSKMEGAQTPRTVYTNGGILNGFRDGRYNVNSTGRCSLSITQLNITDSGKFSCAFTMDANEQKRGSVLVVIDVREACRSNVMNNALNQYDSYNFWTVINVPPKSVEPSNVILSFQNRADGETETTDESQSQTVKTTLAGIARKVNITQRVCRASLSPNIADGFDRSHATLYVCDTQQLSVSYPVEKISFSPSSGPYCKGTTVHCRADGHPYPTIKWIHLKSKVEYGDTLVIEGDADDKYNCTATNTVTGTATPLSETIGIGAACESSDCPRCAASSATVIAILIIIIVCIVIVFAAFVCGWCPGYSVFVWLDSIKKKKDKEREKTNAEALLTNRTSPLILKSP